MRTMRPQDLMVLKLAMQAETLLCQSPKYDQNTM